MEIPFPQEKCCGLRMNDLKQKTRNRVDKVTTVPESQISRIKKRYCVGYIFEFNNLLVSMMKR